MNEISFSPCVPYDVTYTVSSVTLLAQSVGTDLGSVLPDLLKGCTILRKGKNGREIFSSLIEGIKNNKELIINIVFVLTAIFR